MGCLNKIQIIGNLGANPELRYTEDGTPVCNFSVATTESWTPKDGERQEHTEWHRVSMWGKIAEIAAQYLSKGKQVYIEGALRSNKWVDKEGVNRVGYEIRGQQMVLLGQGPPRDAQESPPNRDAGARRRENPPAQPDTRSDDDCPF